MSDVEFHLSLVLRHKNIVVTSHEAKITKNGKTKIIIAIKVARFSKTIPTVVQAFVTCALQAELFCSFVAQQ